MHMEAFWILAGSALWFFAIYGLNETVKTYMTYKVKIAVAYRDAKMYEAEIARATSTQ